MVAETTATPRLRLGEVDVRLALLWLLAVLTVASTLLLTRYGHISADESLYHLMTRSFAQAGSLDRAFQPSQ